jgi:NAD(P)-dependent dehydrogenase (short-subunit alcohol dehydrogenase family)
MDLGLKDKVVLITGGSKGIGLACAFAFAAEGARVAIASRDAANLARRRRSCRRPGTRCSPARPTCAKPPKANAWPPRCRPRWARSTCSSTAPARRSDRRWPS